MLLKAGLIVAVFMHMAWERLALLYAILLPPVAVLVFVGIMAFEADYTLLTRLTFFRAGPWIRSGTERSGGHTSRLGVSQTPDSSRSPLPPMALWRERARERRRIPRQSAPCSATEGAPKPRSPEVLRSGGLRHAWLLTGPGASARR